MDNMWSLVRNECSLKKNGCAHFGYNRRNRKIRGMYWKEIIGEMWVIN